MLPDDDAGRGDLEEVLYPVSLGSNAADNMKGAIEVYAPWLPATEAEALVGKVLAMPVYMRMPTAKALGERLRVTNVEREKLRLYCPLRHQPRRACRAEEGEGQGQKATETTRARLRTT